MPMTRVWQGIAGHTSGEKSQDYSSHSFVIASRSGQSKTVRMCLYTTLSNQEAHTCLCMPL